MLDSSCGENEKHTFTSMLNNFFFRKLCCLWDNVGKYLLIIQPSVVCIVRTELCMMNTDISCSYGTAACQNDRLRFCYLISAVGWSVAWPNLCAAVHNIMYALLIVAQYFVDVYFNGNWNIRSLELGKQCSF